MNVKRYLVKDMNEAMIKIKNDLGMDAVILNTRKIKSGGPFKFLKKPLLEVVAAVDDPIVKPASVQERPRIKASESIPMKSPDLNLTPKDMDILDAIKPKHSDTNTEMNELKEMVSALIKKVENIEKNQPSSDAKVEDDSPEQEYINLLMDLDIQESIAKKIMEIVQRQININEKNKETVLNAIKVITREYLGEIKTIDKDVSESPSVYMFLGPTGVGKTTTLAKIAARLSLVENKKVGLITADTYRIAAVEQLKTYSEILGIPLEVIYESSELKDALHKFSDKDYILIDTAGRSHRSKELKSDYDELEKHLKKVQIFLVLSMTTSYKEMKSIIESYHFIDDYRLLFTKLDEATTYGNILNMKVLTGKNLSYLAIGQSVPDDIELGNKEKIINYIYNSGGVE